MFRTHKINPVLRATGVIGVVAAMVTGVTFAALSSSVTQTDDQFTTATATLKIWNGSSYEDTASGWNFANVVPGTTTPVSTFWLKNVGGVPLTITSVSDNLAVPTNITNPALVMVNVNNVTQAVSASFPLSTLWDTTPDNWPGAAIAPGVEDQYDITLDVPGAAVSGSSASLTNLDLTFTGTQP